MQSFLDMGGYAVFVWPAYGVAVVILAGLLVASVLGLRRRQRELMSLEDGRRERHS
jgi:heme exporter protein D